jgi:hypothetical protein
MKPLYSLIVLCALVITGCTDTNLVSPLGDDGTTLGANASVDPTFIPGAANKTCSEIMPSGWVGFEFKFDVDDGEVVNGTQTTQAEGSSTAEFTVTFENVTDTSFDFKDASMPVDGVFVKSGSEGSNLYVYVPPGPPVTADTGLTTPQPANQEISHVSFCVTPRLIVTKTANATFDRDWDWTIEKSNDVVSTEVDPLKLAEGQSYLVQYTVSGNATKTDHSFSVSGVITVLNPAFNPGNAIVASVSDVITRDGDGDIVADVDCDGITFPKTLTPGESFVCTYSADPPNAYTRLNTATADVTAESAVLGSSGTADVIFGDDPDNETDTCIDLSDTLVESVDQTICLGDLVDGEYQIQYTYDLRDFPDLECDEVVEVPNTASFVTDDNAETDSASSSVWVLLECAEGCTLTMGYWMTHSEFGPAPYDDGWAQLANGASTLFFDSGLTWYQLFWTPPAGGNAYIQLAHQYMAAKLNILNGAATTAAVDDAIAWAEAFFPGKTPSDALSGAVRNQARSYANTLDQYNNGLIGPGHCDEN